MLRNLLVLQRGGEELWEESTEEELEESSATADGFNFIRAYNFQEFIRAYQLGQNEYPSPLMQIPKGHAQFLICLFSRKCSAHEDKPVAFD